MVQPFLSYLDSIQPLSSAAKEALEKNFELIELSKKQILLRDGETCDYLYYVVNGLMRTYYIKDDEEISSLFIEDGYLFNSPHSFYSRKPGYEYIDAIEPSVLARIHYDSLQKLYILYPELNFVARVITEKYFLKSEERLYLLRRQTAEERYLYFSQRYPTLLQRVPLTHIATYLGLSLETLSRIRNKIRK